MSASITRTEWDTKLKHAQDQAQRATKAELARNYSEAFELYVRSGQLFLWLLSNLPTAADNASFIASAQRDGSPHRAQAQTISSGSVRLRLASD